MCKCISNYILLVAIMITALVFIQNADSLSGWGSTVTGSSQGCTITLKMRDKVIAGENAEFEITINVPASLTKPSASANLFLYEDDLFDTEIWTYKYTFAADEWGYNFSKTFHYRTTKTFTEVDIESIEEFYAKILLDEPPGFSDVIAQTSVLSVPIYTDDDYENNDTFAQARDLGSESAVWPLIFADENDYYKCNVTSNLSRLQVQISLLNDGGNLNLYLINPAGQTIASSTTTSDIETIDEINLLPGSYGIRVAPVGTVYNWYDLTIHHLQTLPDHITISGSTSVNENSGAQYTCTAYYSDGSSTNVTNSATWSENSSYASISNPGGYLTTNSVSSNQSCTITAIYGGKTDTHGITIVNVPVPISVTISGATSVNENSGAQYTCMLNYDNGTTANVTNSAIWSENSSYASINSTGYLTTSSVSSNQSCTITASSNGFTDTHDITIVNVPVPVSVIISGSTSVNENSSAQYTCTLNYDNGTTANVTNSATWSENSSYASINSTGYLTTSSVSSSQSCTITATSNGFTDTHDITILDGTDTTPPTNPTVPCVETNGVQNNVSQNTVNDPNFTWSGASDGSGSGVKQYYFYWGIDSNGTSTNFTTSLGHDPLAVSPGTYYLRVQTEDNAGNKASWTTLFIFIYSGQGGDPYEPDNTLATIKPQAINTKCNPAHSINPAGDEDWVSFTLNNTSNITIETSGQIAMYYDTVVYLCDQSFQLLAYDDDSGIDFFQN